MLTDIKESLLRARDDTGLPTVLRIAVHAGHLVAEKYEALMDESEIYKISIGTSTLLPIQKISSLLTFSQSCVQTAS